MVSYQTEQIGEVSLRGKDLKITVHRVLGKQSICPLTTDKGGCIMSISSKIIFFLVLSSLFPVQALAVDNAIQNSHDGNADFCR